MPRKPTTKTVAPGTPPLPAASGALSIDERVLLRQVLASPIFQRALSLTEASRPSLFPPMSMDGPLAMQTSYAILHELRGWEKFRRALNALVDEPISRHAEVPFTYTDEH